MTTRERDPELLKQLGTHLREGRQRTGLSQRALAEAAGGDFSYSWLQAIERGMQPDGRPASPKAATLLLLVRRINGALPPGETPLDERELLQLAGVPNPDLHLPSPTVRPTVSTRALAEKIGALPDDLRQAINTIVDSYLTKTGLVPADEPVHHVTHKERPRSTTPGPVHHVTHEEPSRD